MVLTPALLLYGVVVGVRTWLGDGILRHESHGLYSPAVHLLLPESDVCFSGSWVTNYSVVSLCLLQAKGTQPRAFLAGTD